VSPCTPDAAPRTGRRTAFSLIEVLAAMTILSVLVLMAAQLFAGSAQFWKLGSRRIEQDMNARAALELIGRQLVVALGDEELLTFRIDEGDTCFLGGSKYSTISMVTMDHQARRIRASPTDSTQVYFRDVQQTQYAVLKTPTNAVLTRYGVYREYPEETSTRIIQCYDDPNWPVSSGWPEPQILAENVVYFDARVFVEPRASPGTINAASIPYTTYGAATRPLWVDLTLFLVDEDDWIKALAAGTNHFNRSMRRYTYRVHLQNSRGMDMK
jgi:prepilin-type N-terminal cleavage/methylation domain-containing protein